MGHQIADVATWIVIVALVTTIVAHKNSAAVITAATNGFAKSLKAAQGL